MIKVIAFDYAEVVAQGPISSWIRKNLAPGDEKIKLFERHSRSWDIGEIDLLETNKIMSEITGIALEKIWEELYETSLPNKDVINLIRVLKKNYKVI